MKETRRDFIKKTGGCALGMVGLATQMHHLGGITAMAQKAIDSQPDVVTDYKALVLLYWQGGCDGNNIVIPNHIDGFVSNWATYSGLRVPQSQGGLAFDQTQLAPTNIFAQSIGGGLNYALHPNFGTGVAGAINNGIHELYAQGKLAVVANVGNLVVPMTKANYQSAAYKKPYQLFSHSDQVTQSQTSNAATQAFTGWGGRLADSVDPLFNYDPVTGLPLRLVPMITSIAGAQLFTAGQSTLPMAISQANNTGTNNLTTVLNPAGFGTNPTGSTLSRLDTFNALRQQDLNSSNYVKAASNVTDLAIRANNALKTSQDVTVTFPNTSIGLQLKQVARMIKSRNNLNVSRQVFYVQVGSFDTHTAQLTTQGNLVTQISQAMRSFWDELGPGAQNVQDLVTTFTLSDFGRTMNPAAIGGSTGSDHAWGNHMLVMGGAVAGGNIYGSRRPDAGSTGDFMPTLTLGGLDDVDTGTAPRGRWLPTTSVDQYCAVLAKWFGLPQDAATLASVFPNLHNFADPNSLSSTLRFMG